MSGKSNVITVELSEDHLKGQIKAAPVEAVSELFGMHWMRKQIT